MNSLLLSNMECFYLNSSCFSAIINYTRLPYDYLIEYPPWPKPRALVHNSTLTHFDPNTSILLLAKEMMLEHWNPLYSYDRFYNSCLPTYCIYTEKKQAKSMLEICLTVISLIGGLTVSLRLFTKILINFIIKIMSKICKNRAQQSENEAAAAVVLNWRDRLKSMIKKLFDLIINLNIFPPHYFECGIDQTTVKRFGQQATHLYLILLISSFASLIIYTIIRQQIQTNEFNKPSFDRYNELIETYGEHLKCSCSSVASTYDQFVQIEPIFHPICSSSFVSDEFIDDLRINSVYKQRDYRGIISAHIQYLQGLCQMSIDTVNNTKEQFLSSLFLTKYLLSNNEFEKLINSSIQHVQLSSPNILTTISLLIRNINFGNSIISTYQTNFKYFIPSYLGEPSFQSFQTESMIYDNNCSCALHLNCSSQAYINKITMKGLKIGCLPSEAFRLSTLECFYDASCIHTIKKSMNLTYKLKPLSLITNQQFRINQTINELIQILFTKQWKTTLNYSVYFQRCSPSLCSYTYVQKLNPIYIVSFLLGLHGGLTIVLKWICPNIVQYITKIKNYRNRRSTVIHPQQSLRTIPTIQSTIIRTIRSDSHLIKYILASVLFILLIMGLTFFSIHIVQKRVSEFTVTSSTSTITTTITTNTMTTS